MTTDIAEAPTWLVQLFDKPETPARVADPDVELDLPFSIAEGRKWLARQPPAAEGNASDTFFRYAAYLKDRALSPETIIDLLHEHSPDYEPDDIGQRVENAFKHGQNEPGCDRPISDDEKFAEVQIPEEAKKPRPPFPKILTLGEARQLPDTPIQWVWQDRVRFGNSNLYTGDQGLGKTTLAENIAVHVAAGVPLLGYPVMKMPVLFLAGEDSMGELRGDFAEIANAVGIEPGMIDMQIRFCSTIDHMELLAAIHDDGQVEWSPWWIEAIKPALLEHAGDGPCLLIIDPIDAFVPANKLSPRPAGAYGRRFAREIANLNGGRVTPLIFDHPSGASMTAGHHVAGDMQYRAGFSMVATYKKADEPAQVEGGTEHRRVLETLKARRAAESKTLIYRYPSTRALGGTSLLAQAIELTRQRVYDYIREHPDKRVSKSTQSGTGPHWLAGELNVEQREIISAFDALEADKSLTYVPRGSSGGRGNKSATDVAPHFVVLNYPRLKEKGPEETPEPVAEPAVW